MENGAVSSKRAPGEVCGGVCGGTLAAAADFAGESVSSWARVRAVRRGEATSEVEKYLPASDAAGSFGRPELFPDVAHHHDVVRLEGVRRRSSVDPVLWSAHFQTARGGTRRRIVVMSSRICRLGPPMGHCVRGGGAGGGRFARNPDC